MVIDNAKMLAAFDAADRIRYYPQCVDLSLAGEDYKVNRIVCFVRDENDPLREYMQVKHYDDGFLLILVHTEEDTLIDEGMAYVKRIRDAFSEIELRTSRSAVWEKTALREEYSYETPEYPPSPVYYLHSADELPPRPARETVSVSLYRGEEDRAEIARLVKEGRLDGESMNGEMFVPCEIFREVRWYILRVCGEIAGYLRAECGYADIYDIGWLYIEPRFRGKGYAVDLVTAFSAERFAAGTIPHYGYAISEASARTAEKCGYVCDPPLY